jgi:MarR family transcriptional regulator for hemolysin
MAPPPGRPIGLTLARTAKSVSRAFDEALATAGGSLPTWLILLSVRTRGLGNQRELAEAVGIRGATLTHHLNTLEVDGLLTRRRDPANRRIHRVELTDKGEALFRRMRVAAIAFDRQLRHGFNDGELRTLAQLLARLHNNIADDDADDSEPGSTQP